MYVRNFMQRPLTNLQDIYHTSFTIKCNANENRQKHYHTTFKKSEILKTSAVTITINI